jgi:hypothetical protein
MLPDFRTKLKEIMERKRVADDLKAAVERYGLIGFATHFSKEKAKELDGVVEELMRKISELEDQGVLVRDVQSGLVDFPAERFGERVYLCWKYGEADVLYWHKHDEGFGGRRPLKAQLVPP